MNYYYALNGQQQGPISEAELDALVAAGTITADTLVWREGLANWQPYQEVRGAANQGAAAPPTMRVAAPPAAASGNQVLCSVCGGAFPVEDTIRYGTSIVCANCKPRFVQQLREGSALAGTTEYASFGTRFGAKFLDGIILGIGGRILLFAVKDSNALLAAPILAFGFDFLVRIIYNSIFLAKWGATPGKMACKIEVVNADGSKLSVGQAIGRSCAEILSGILCLAGYIMAAFDDEKRALHDRLAQTRVVKK